MMTKKVDERSGVFRMGDHLITIDDIINTIIKNQGLPTLIRNLIIEKAIEDINIPKEKIQELISEMKENQNLQNTEEYMNFLNQQNLSEELLIEMLCRPHKIVHFREETWGPRINSIYLNKKENYDLVTYRRLESNNADIMQEVYFRLKDKEETWESIARQFPGASKDANAIVDSVSVKSVEKPLLQALRNAKKGVPIQPIRVDESSVVVAEIIEFHATRLDDELKAKILGEEFESWLQQECTNMIKNISFQK